MPRLIVFVLVLSLSYAGLLRAQPEPSDDPWLKITVSNASCRLILSRPDTAEATPEPEATPDSPTPEYPVMRLGDDCQKVLALLRVSSNSTLWIALSAPDETEWQRFEQVADDENPPRLDRRGRYVGCSIPELGEQVCQVLWSHQGITYRIVIPVFVTGRVEAAVTATLVAPTDEPDNPSPGETSSQTNPSAITPPTEPPPLPTLACEDTPAGCGGDQ